MIRQINEKTFCERNENNVYKIIIDNTIQEDTKLKAITNSIDNLIRLFTPSSAFEFF